MDDDQNKSKLLSGWVFDGDPSTGTSNYNLNHDPISTEMCNAKGDEYQYSLDQLVKMLQRKYGERQQQTLQDDLVAPIPLDTIENEDAQNQAVRGASSYGNCLAILKCTCQTCEIDDSKEAGSSVPKALPSFYLAHPSGEDLSFVTIRKIRFPRDDTLPVHRREVKCTVTNNIDTTISRCGIVHLCNPGLYCQIKTETYLL